MLISELPKPILNIRTLKNIVVYIEKIDRKNKYLLLDFPIKTVDADYHREFFQRINQEYSEYSSSMLEISNVEFENFGAPREGHYYYLPEGLINRELWSRNSEEDNENTYIALRISRYSGPLLNFQSALPYHNFTSEAKSTNTSILKETISKFRSISNTSKKVILVVRNVGQGNMNELHFGIGSFVLFDMGARNSSDIIPVIRTVFKGYRRYIRLCEALSEENLSSFRAFVLSHWDVDHYSGLFSMTVADSSLFHLFVVPQVLPTKTSQRAFDKLSSANRNILSIPMRHRHPIKNATRLQCIFRTNIFKLYRGSNHYNRNKSGLSIIASSETKDVLFTGDLHYEQINDYLMPYCLGKEQYVVIPHHGGNAGDEKIINRWSGMTEAIISVGDNPWGHPLPKITEILNGVIPRGVYVTRIARKDYTKTL